MQVAGVGNVDITDGAQVYLGDVPAGDGDLAAGMRPDDIVAGRQRRIDTSKNHPAVESAFPDSCVNHTS